MQFDKLRTNTFQVCVTGDSRNIDLIDALGKRNSDLCDLVQGQKIRGIFSSPPYIGLIDYHEQHAYAYELFGFPRNDDSEIGPLSSGQTLAARDKYVEYYNKSAVVEYTALRYAVAMVRYAACGGYSPTMVRYDAYIVQSVVGEHFDRLNDQLSNHYSPTTVRQVATTHEPHRRIGMRSTYSRDLNFDGFFL